MEVEIPRFKMYMYTCKEDNVHKAYNTRHLSDERAWQGEKIKIRKQCTAQVY